jgi:hypothetical protein
MKKNKQPTICILSDSIKPITKRITQLHTPWKIANPYSMKNWEIGFTHYQYIYKCLDITASQCDGCEEKLH